MIEKRFYSVQMRRSAFSIFMVLFLITGFQNPPIQAESCCPDLTDERWNTRWLDDGIKWKHAEFHDIYDSPQYLNLILADADTLAQQVVFAAADRTRPGERHLKPSEFAGHYRTLAVVNAGFFTDHPEYVNTGIFKWEGDLLPFLKQESEEIYFVGGSAVGIDKDGGWIFYNREEDIWPDDWLQAHSAIAGGHRLIEDGSIMENILNEDYKTNREIRHAGQRHPRTAVCLTENQQILLLVADGRHEEAVGFTLSELAALLSGFGCNDAINLDGGGSSTMYIEGKGVVNHPSDNGKFDRTGERAVRTVLIITEPEQ